jgi:hypothetical protein
VQLMPHPTLTKRKAVIIPASFTIPIFLMGCMCVFYFNHVNFALANRLLWLRRSSNFVFAPVEINPNDQASADLAPNKQASTNILTQTHQTSTQNHQASVELAQNHHASTQNHQASVELAQNHHASERNSGAQLHSVDLAQYDTIQGTIPTAIDNMPAILHPYHTNHEAQTNLTPLSFQHVLGHNEKSKSWPNVGKTSPERSQGLAEPSRGFPVELTQELGHQWNVAPLQVLLHAHLGKSALPNRACISVVLDTSTFDLFGQIAGVVQHAPIETNLFVFVGLPDDSKEKHTKKFFDVLRNTSVPEDTSVDFVGMGIPLHTKQATRLFRLATHARSEIQAHEAQSMSSWNVPTKKNFILILHHSCVVDIQWNVANLTRRGRGYLLLPSTVSNQEIYTEIAQHDLGLTTGSIISHRHPGASSAPSFHCSGNLMHALHGPHH